MRLLLFFTLCCLTAVGCSSEQKVGDDDLVNEEKLASPRMEAQGDANGVGITVDYGSPAVRDRKIWGNLEKYGKVWRAGANETTTITLDKDATINGAPLAEGKYAFFIIPRENDDWILIFNTDWDEWGAFSYNQEYDVLRIFVKPVWEERNQERLEYSISGGKLNFSWEKVRLALDIKAG